MVPGSPAYTSRIPRPPCFQCGEDHFPNREYTHEWQPEPAPIHDEPVAASPAFRRSATVVEMISDQAQHRVALYVGRGDTYVVAVEAAPDWDAVTTFKVEPAMVLPLVQLARALKTKIADKTGGDLMMLEQEYAGEHAQANGRSAQGAGSGGARRSGLAAGGPQEGGPPGAEPPAAGAD
jgi:hypothetical protein